MATTPTEKVNHDPVFRTIDLSAEAKRMWGAKWGAPETSYEFSNGRKFELLTGDSLIYKASNP